MKHQSMISIDRHNYEEFFLLYIDNELSVEERSAVEEFVRNNPDLEIEFTMLQQSTLPKDELVFEGKETLLKTLVNQSNYEEYFVLYGDNELTNQEKELVEEFVYKHPQYQAEFELITSIRMEPDHAVIFPDKRLLLRKERKPLVISINWKRMAAAAILILFLGVAGYLLLDNNTTETPPIVGKPSTPSITIPVDTVVDTPVIEEQVATVEEAAPSSGAVKPVKRNAPVVSRPEPVLANISNTTEEKNSSPSNIQIASNVTLKKPDVEVDVVAPVAKGSVVTEIPANQQNELVQFARVEEDEFQILNTSISKKNTLRGLFRKVSRVVGKATNVDASENNKGIQIASFEIGIK